ncbi:MAG TPA: multicopper oxidase domain-containing protein, partial [Actinomycetota bacterium]
QLDTGLYAPLIVEDPSEAGTYDRDIPILLDDWIDGTGETPDEVLERLLVGGSAMQDMESDASAEMDGMDGMEGMPGGDEGTDGNPHEGTMQEGEELTSGTVRTDGPLGDDTGDVNYPAYLINGRTPSDPAVFEVGAGDRVRLRIINAGSDTPFRVAVGGTPMRVVATDGFAVVPVTVDTLLVGMGERYDVVVSVPGDGAFPLVADAEGKSGRALAVLSAGAGEMPMADIAVPELQGRLLVLDDLVAAESVSLLSGEPDRKYRVGLAGSMATYNWAITAAEEEGVTLPVHEGERVRLVFENQTAMWHPLHLHGQTFQVVRANGTLGARKDTVIIPARGQVAVEFIADNPGQWALHCHNIYHAEAGMVITLTYVT